MVSNCLAVINFNFTRKNLLKFKTQKIRENVAVRYWFLLIIRAVKLVVHFYREADHETSEANDDGLVDEDVLEVKDESSFDERLGGSSATLLSRWDSLLGKLLVFELLFEVAEAAVSPEAAGGPVVDELLRIRLRSSVNLA